MVVEIHPRMDVSIPPEVIAEIDRIKQIDTGQIGILNWPASYPLPAEQVADLKIVTNVASGYVDVKIHASDIMVPANLQARYYLPSKEIDTLVNPGSIVTGVNHVSVSNFRTKTVIGKCNFDGTLYIDLSPSGTDNYFPDTYTKSVSSGVVFIASWTEAGDYCVVRIENSSTVTGKATVWVVRQV